MLTYTVPCLFPPTDSGGVAEGGVGGVGVEFQDVIPGWVAAGHDLASVPHSGVADGSSRVPGRMCF